MDDKKLHIATRAVQSGYSPKNAEPRIPSITQSTTYKYDSAEQLGDVFDLKESSHLYSRISNPTIQALEEKIAALEGGTGALAFASGHAAISAAIFNLCSSGDHFISTKSLYGGTFNMFSQSFKKFNISVTFVDQDASAKEIEKHITANTKLIYAESLTNPGMEVLDFEKFVAIAKKNELPLVIDNTFPTPILCRPIEHGANLVIHSTTKFIDGHATSVGGVIVDGGNFNWKNPKFPEFNTPDPTYNQVIYSERFKETAFIVKAKNQIVKDLGPCMSPFNAFMTFHGCQTLALRMKQHAENALHLAQFLKEHPKAQNVKYAGLPDNPYYSLAQKYMPMGTSGVLAFDYCGTLEETKTFINKLRLVSLVVHVGDIRSSVVHPASMTHRQLTEQQLKEINIAPSSIRVSVGIEDINDIIADFEQAL